MPFDIDVADDAGIADLAISEGRKRVHAVMPALTDQQFDAWVADARRRGARFVLVPGGVVAEYDRHEPLDIFNKDLTSK